MPPNHRLNENFTERSWLCWDIEPAVISTRNVLWASSMPTMRWRPGPRPEPQWGAHDAPQTSGRLGRGHPLSHPSARSAPRFSRLRRSALCPQCKILVTPLSDCSGTILRTFLNVRFLRLLELRITNFFEFYINGGYIADS